VVFLFQLPFVWAAPQPVIGKPPQILYVNIAIFVYVAGQAGPAIKPLFGKSCEVIELDYAQWPARPEAARVTNKTAR
jgi:hypothetical protein